MVITSETNFQSSNSCQAYVLYIKMIDTVGSIIDGNRVRGKDVDERIRTT